MLLGQGEFLVQYRKFLQYSATEAIVSVAFPDLFLRRAAHCSVTGTSNDD